MAKKKETVYLKDRSIGFRVSIPDYFVEVKKENFPKLGIEKNTLFVFSVNKDTTFSVSFAGFANDKDFENLAKYNADKFSDDEIELIHSEKTSLAKAKAYTYILKTNTKKIKQTVVLVNEMLLNFAINLDNKNLITDIDKLKKSKECLILDEIIKTLNIFTPINPPVFLEEEVKKPRTKLKGEKSLSQIIIEKESKYRGIQVPEFYFKYNYFKDGEVVLLTTIDKDLYFSGFRDSFVIVDDGHLSIKLRNLVDEYLNELQLMDIASERPKSNSAIVVKTLNNYLYIDLESNVDKKVLNRFFLDLLDIFEDAHIDGNVVFPSKIIDLERKTEEVPIKLNVSDEEVLEEEIVEEPVVFEEKEIVEEPVVFEENEIVEEAASIEEEAIVTETMQIEEIVTEPSPIQKEVVEVYIPKEEVKISRLIGKELKVEGPDTAEIFHFMEDDLIFKFIIPKKYNNKILREFNVFDLEANDGSGFRVFLFPCENKELYEAKVLDWMNKNAISNGEIIEEHHELLDNGEEEKNYLFENGKYYKIIYLENYLIAISDDSNTESLGIADFIIRNLQIIKTSPGYNEAFERKLRSLEILKAQEIPFLQELPLIESSYEVYNRSVDEIARRAIALCISANFAIDVANAETKKEIRASKKFFEKLLDSYKVRNDLSESEKKLFETMDKNLAIQISWQFEGLVILYWALGILQDISYPNVLTNPQVLSSILSEAKTYIEFVNRCELRNVHEILDLADLTYRYDWYCVDAKLNNVDLGDKLNPEIVLERHRALNWLIQNANWDDVNIDT